MAINYDKLMTIEIPNVEQTYTARDTILHALGVGLGQDPMDEQQLSFVYEEGLKALPTLANVLGLSGSWIRQQNTGIDALKVVHGEQALTLHKPLPPAGTVVGKTRVVDVIDKGADKGAVIISERRISDKATGKLLATVLGTTFARGDGGFGGPPRKQPSPHPIPDRAPDLTCELKTRPETALIYRLSGDYNPLHADPRTAKAAGFPRPIIHGLATFSIAGHAILKCMVNYNVNRVRSLAGRFSAPAFPGETIHVDMWRDGPIVSFRASIAERNAVILNNGRAEID